MGGEVEMGVEVDMAAEAASTMMTMMTMMTETLEVAVVLAEEHTTAGTMEYSGLGMDVWMTMKPGDYVKQDQCPKATDQRPRPTTIGTIMVKERHQETKIGERPLDRVLMSLGRPRKAHWEGSDDDTQKSKKKRSITDEDE